MRLDDIKFSFKEMMLVVTLVATVLGSWYNLKLENHDLKSKLDNVEKKVNRIDSKLQWLLGEAIISGWRVPKQPWIDPTEKEE